LVGAGERGRSVVAKLCRGRHRHTEQRIYEDVLPRLRVPLPRFYGSVELADGIWLFLEDGGETRCDPEIPAHRALAARWLASLHGAASCGPFSDLPDRGPAHHLELLRSGRRAMLDNLANPAFDAGHRAVLDSFLGVCDELEARWREIEEVSVLLPRTLVHGDFCRKNLHIRSEAEGLEFFPMDWEMAGWGVPACDLIPCPRLKQRPICDLAVYGAAMREHWPKLDRSLLRRAVALGSVFRCLCGLNWTSVELPNRWPQRPILTLQVYRDELAAGLRGSAWTA